MTGVLTRPDATAHAVCEIHDTLAACGDLRPTQHVSEVFTRLVRLVIDEPHDGAAAVLALPGVAAVLPRLRALCCEGEYELELAWARHIAASPDPAAALERFPYLDNYRQLSRMEWLALRSGPGAAGHRTVERVAFLGSGPLPLTAFLLARDGLRIDNIDRDDQALAASRQVAAALGIGGLSFLRVDVGDGPVPAGFDVAAYDLVVLAALVGRTGTEKSRVIAHLAAAMAPGALLIARSARGLRTLLYPALDTGDLAPLEVLDIVHPTGDVINSVVVARKPEDR